MARVAPRSRVREEVRRVHRPERRRTWATRPARPLHRRVRRAHWLAWQRTAAWQRLVPRYRQPAPARTRSRRRTALRWPGHSPADGHAWVSRERALPGMRHPIRCDPSADDRLDARASGVFSAHPCRCAPSDWVPAPFPCSQASKRRPALPKKKRLFSVIFVGRPRFRCVAGTSGAAAGIDGAVRRWAVTDNERTPEALHITSRSNVDRRRTDPVRRTPVPATRRLAG